MAQPKRRRRAATTRAGRDWRFLISDLGLRIADLRIIVEFRLWISDLGLWIYQACFLVRFAVLTDETIIAIISSHSCINESTELGS